METKKFKNSEERKKILDRINKIMALAKGSSFEGEADTAMKMAQSYMRQYGLSMSDIEFQEELKTEIKHNILEEESPRNIQVWTRMLAGSIAIVFDCQFVTCKNYKGKGIDKLSFIGYTEDIEMTKVVFHCLYTSIRQYSRIHYKRPLDKNSFRLGVCSRLLERVREEKQKDKQESKRYELIIVEKSTHVKKWFEENLNVTKSKERNNKINPFAHAHGRKHADSLDLGNRAKVENQKPVLAIGRQ